MVKIALVIIGIIIVAFLVGGFNNAEKVKVEDLSSNSISFPVKQLINKTPAEIETLTGFKVEDSFEGIGGKIMNATIELNGVSIETAYTLINHPEVKYNGTLFFNIWFDNPINEDKAWEIVGLLKLDKKQAYDHSMDDKKFTWRDISPFFEIQAGYNGEKIEYIECYLLMEEENMKLYE